MNLEEKKVKSKYSVYPKISKYSSVVDILVAVLFLVVNSRVMVFPPTTVPSLMSTRTFTLTPPSDTEYAVSTNPTIKSER